MRPLTPSRGSPPGLHAHSTPAWMPTTLWVQPQRRQHMHLSEAVHVFSDSFGAPPCTLRAAPASVSWGASTGLPAGWCEWVRWTRPLPWPPPRRRPPRQHACHDVCGAARESGGSTRAESKREALAMSGVRGERCGSTGAYLLERDSMERLAVVQQPIRHLCPSGHIRSQPL